MKLFLIVIIASLNLQASALINLEKFQQNFVLGTKQIKIPEFPDAFNPSIASWQGNILMSFRARNSVNNKANLVGLIWLDSEFKPLGSPQIIHIKRKFPEASYIQDPRLLSVNGQMYLIYSDLWDLSKTTVRRMCISKVKYDGVRFSVAEPAILLESNIPLNEVEKNWVPFEYSNQCLLSYSIFPHRTMLPLYGEKSCVELFSSHERTNWKWGEIRGGTPALSIGNHYLAFFHSSKNISSIQSDGMEMTHYFMGAYLFESEPPFKIVKMSSMPIVSKKFYNGKDYPTWKPLRVIFPCGYIYDEQNIWISYGRQDHESWIVQLKKQELLDSLSKVKELE